MLGIHELWLFVLSGLVLNITPGPDTAYILGRSIQLGWRGGAAAVFGICSGCLVHVFAAAIGLSALLMASSTAFAILKLAGAAYPLFTGIQMLLARSGPIADVAVQGAATSLASVFWQGALTNVLNPKVALFFLALMPQFIGAGSNNKVAAFLVLGFTFVSLGVVWCCVLAIGAAKLRGAFVRRPSIATWLNRVAGAMFIGLGIKLATARQ